MEIHILKPTKEDLSIKFDLAPFITDWAGTQAKFIAVIAREFGEFLSVRPQDFHSNLSMELGESWCKYRIFGGTSGIVLNPEALQLDFVSFNESNYPTVLTIIRKSLDVLLKEIGSHRKYSVSLTFNQHVGTVENGIADVYLNQFAWKQPADVVKLNSEIAYKPAVKVILSDNSDEERPWVLHRLVEKSEWLPDGLFVTTIIFVSSPEVTAFDDQHRLVRRIYALADQAVGLRHPGDSDDDAAAC